MKPQTKYTKSGRINIAYQVIGEGDIDIVYVPGWVSNIDLMWECPQLVAFFQGLTKVGRLILFDKRGTGLSDRVTDLSTLEERMDDIRAVMDAEDVQQAVLFGHSEGGSVSALFAATYPSRTHSLITFGVFAKRRWSHDYPWAPTDQERQVTYDMIEEKWGSGDMDLVSLAPSMEDDKSFMDWIARYFRSGASPSAALALTKMNTDIDIRGILHAIKVPSLFMCCTGDVDVKVDESKYMARQVPGAKVVEFDTSDHFFWARDADKVVDEITSFVSDVRPISDHQELLSTIMITEIADPGYHIVKSGDTKWLLTKKNHDDIMRSTSLKYRGSEIRKRINGFVNSFDGPSKAAHCALEMIRLVGALDLRLKISIHIGELIVHADGTVGGKAMQIADKILSDTNPNEVRVSETVSHLLSGAGLSMSQRSDLSFGGQHEQHSTYAIQDIIEPTPIASANTSLKGQNHSFLEDVLQAIETNMADEDFGMSELSREVGISERQLQRKLKSITNKTPNQMVRSVRLHKAREILQQQVEGISQVAFQTGFSSPSYFTKCFRKEFGVSPSDVVHV